MESVTLQDLARATNGRLRDVDPINLSVKRITTDSRDVTSGDVFWALSGTTHDGHNFVDQATSQKALLSVVSSHRAPSIAGPVLVVDDPLSALGRFASWYRSQFDALIIGVTGSVGKTTTRELIFAALSAKHSGIRSRKNFNNLIGLPLTLLELQSDHEFAVLEMGASKIGDIRELCELTHPEICAITSVGPAHLQTFGSLEAIYQTKGELLEYLPSSGFAVMPGDDEMLRSMSSRAACPVIFVGQNDNNRIRATRVEVTAGCLRFTCEGQEFKIPVNGRHVLANALCAIAIGLEFGISTDLLAAGLANFQSEPGRGNLLRIGPWCVIDDTYNASPLSVSAACHLLHELSIPAGGRRLLILGDMRELGSLSCIEHEKIGRLAAELRFDRLLVCGQFADSVAEGAERAGMKSHQIAASTDVDTLLAILDCWLEPNALMLVKGSRATRMDCVIDWLKTRAGWEIPHSEISQRRICA